MPKKLEDCKTLADVEDLLTGRVSEDSLCIDCGLNTQPGAPTKKQTALAIWEAREAGKERSDTIEYSAASEVYCVRDKVWKEAGMEPWRVPLHRLSGKTARPQAAAKRFSTQPSVQQHAGNAATAKTARAQ
jgi:hypothetical protein